MITRETYEAYVRHLMAGNQPGCARLVDQLVQAKVETRELYRELFERALYEVGELWECNRISVATEHLATAITESLMNSLRAPLFASPRVGKRAVIACSAHEYHQVGAKMVADVFELHGWDAYFLGANTPTDALVRFVGDKGPNATGLSLSLKSNLPVLAGLIDQLRKEYPKLDILVGGQAFRNGAGEWVRRWTGVKHVPSLEELEPLLAGQ